MIGILNYGIGNVQAFLKCYNRLNIECKPVSFANEAENCTHLILPGVGSFDHAMCAFNDSGLRPAIEKHVSILSKPVLGVCVGMQMLGDSSQEGLEPGLRLISGLVKKLNNVQLPLPHMGWNLVAPLKEHPIFENAENDLEFYFLHSYAFSTTNNEVILGKTKYGDTFASIINQKNIYGIQCHPEKSHGAGLNFLKNFARMK